MKVLTTTVTGEFKFQMPDMLELTRHSGFDHEEATYVISASSGDERSIEQGAYALIRRIEQAFGIDTPTVERENTKLLLDLLKLAKNTATTMTTRELQDTITLMIEKRIAR